FIASLLQALNHVHRIAADGVALQGVLPAGQYFGSAASWWDSAQGKAKRLEQLFQHGQALCGERGWMAVESRENCADSSIGRLDGERRREGCQKAAGVKH